MLDQIVFEEPWKGIKVSAYTDRYAYDPEDDSLLYISLAGSEQAVKAISSAIIGSQTVRINGEGNAEITLRAHPATRFRVLSAKLAYGAVHQAVADSRFFDGNDSMDRLVNIPRGEGTCSAVYSQVLSHLASPLIPEWAPWLCDELKKRGLMREMKGTLRVVEICVDEGTVDEIISEGVKAGRISLDTTGGSYAGIA